MYNRLRIRDSSNLLDDAFLDGGIKKNVRKEIKKFKKMKKRRSTKIAALFYREYIRA